MRIAIVHDYLTQRGGAERVVLAMCRTFPDAVLFTSLYEPDRTFDEFRSLQIVTSPINRIRVFRQRHRYTFPLLAGVFERMHIDADVAVCSSSGWAHGASVVGAKVVYCHTPARWLYARDRAFLQSSGARMLAPLARPLVLWDRRAARSADVYAANSRWVAAMVERAYGRTAEVVPPPVGVAIDGPSVPLEGLAAPFVLCVARLVPYKNVDAIVGACRQLPELRFVVVGEGPEAARLRRLAPANVNLLRTVTDGQLRWLYENALGLVSASYEDFGLTPVEAAAYGTPTAALRFGGHLDTVIEGQTGVFFDRPEPAAIAEAIVELRAKTWDAAVIRRHATRFSETKFSAQLRRLVDQAVLLRSGG